MKRKSLYVFLIALVALLAIAVYIGMPYAYIATSYASKITCSCHYLSGRQLDDIKHNDLYAVPYTSVRIDEDKKSVTASICGLAKATAVYRKGFGCTLLNGSTEADLNQQRFTFQRRPRAHVFPKAAVGVYFDTAKFKALVDRAFESDAERLQTRAVVVLKNGKLVYERYARGYHASTRLLGWSMTKSVTNALLGILVKQGKLDLYKPAPVKEWQADARQSITINDMLHMSSGLSFEEHYGKPCDATDMLFRSHSVGHYALSSKLIHKPGAVFSYSSGTTNALQELIRRQFPSTDEYHSFPYEQLFDKIGMASAVLEPDASGTFIGSSFMFATALDWARFGQLYLQQGVWQGEEIFPPEWTRYSATATPNSEGKYAAHFWVNPVGHGFPKDTYFANGFEGQYINIIPSQDLVVVRLGCSHGGAHFDNAAFITGIVEAQK